MNQFGRMEAGEEVKQRKHIFDRKTQVFCYLYRPLFKNLEISNCSCSLLQLGLLNKKIIDIIN